jgi:hypothetical protein
MSETKQKLIASFEKNSAEVVRIHLQTWKSQRYVDIRVWAQARPGDGEAAAQPTHKGITLNVELLDELRKAIDSVFAAIELEEPKGGEQASGSEAGGEGHNG